MGGCRCTYKNCQNTTKTTENIHFFHYPVKYKERCAIWIKNANKSDFCMLEEDQLRNKVICEQHFDSKWFPNSQRKRLLQGAVPTLDGDSINIIESSQLSEIFREKTEPDLAYMPSEMDDIQVLPANDDGTIFVLDTDSMFNRSQKVESYTYKNGMIVPSKLKFEANKSILPSITPVKVNPKPSSLVPKKEVELELRPSQPLKRQHSLQGPGDCVEISKLYKQIKTEVPEYCEGTSSDNARAYEEIYEREIVYDNSNKRLTTNPEKSVVVDKKIDQSYLRKIDQHSKDIASIKKMLKQKAFDMKMDIKTALNAIKEELPPSLFTVLSLCLNYKCDLTDEDVDFFTTVHKTSPEVYQLLVDKYKWSLPCVDIVEETSTD